MLWKHARTGAFQASADCVEQTSNSNSEVWLRCSASTFQPSNSNSFTALIDAQHARAKTFGLQTASQFGFGVYDIDVHLVPSNNALNPEDSRLAFGQVAAQWMEPTPARMLALKSLKDLERLEDRADPFQSTANVQQNPAGNPLLAVGMASDADTTASSSPIRGSRIIRFGWGGGQPKVYAQSTLTVDLNSDDDTSDAYEDQSYVLLGDDGDYFAIMPRYEHAVNPVKDGHRLVEHEWAYPTSITKVQDFSTLRHQVVWACNVKPENSAGTNLPGGIHTQKAEFRGIRALGGLIRLSMPEFATSAIGNLGTANNDFELHVNLRCRSWTPMV
jgi:hypothetical protein